MKLTMLALAAAIAIPTVAIADSSQPNSAPGLQGKPVTKQGEGTSGMSSSTTAPRQTTGSGTTDAGKTGGAGTTGAKDSSIPGATNPNQPMGTKK